jgi:hypothetical protein
MDLRTLLAATSATLLLAGTASAAPLVVNGDFQTGNASGWTTPTAGTTVDANAGPAGAGDYALHVQSGDWAAVTTANNGAWMGTGNTTYTVSFDVKAGAPTSSKQTDVFMQKAYGGNNPAYLAVQNSALLGDGQWHQVTWDFAATEPFNLGIYTEGNGGIRDIYFDNFSVAAVPEPAALGLLAGAGLLSLRRRRLEVA